MGSFELIFSDFDSEIPPGEVLRSDSVISIQKFTQGGVLNSDSVISILKLPQGGRFELRFSDVSEISISKLPQGTF